MVTFRSLVQSHHRKKDGTYNVKIRVIHNNVVKYIATDEFVTKQDLSRSLEIKNQDIEDKLNLTIKKYRDKVRSKGEVVSAMTADQLVSYLQSDDVERFDLDFIQFGREKADEMERIGKVGSAGNYRTMLNSLVDFMGRDKISISEITSSFLITYENWLKTSTPKTKKAKGNRSVSLYTGYIRSLHNLAKREYNDEDTGIIRIPWSPFTKYKVPKPPTTRKRSLSRKQLVEIFKLKNTGDRRFDLAKDVFMLSFYFIGMNTADLYSCEKIEHGRLTYKRAKTKSRRKDEALISIRVEPEAQNLLKKYKGKTKAFCFCDEYATKGNFNKAVNKGLKQIGDALKIEDLEFYAARHTWATLAVNEVEIDKYTVHTALNHADESMKVTDIYIKKDWKIIDEANRKVLDYIKDR